MKLDSKTITRLRKLCDDYNKYSSELIKVFEDPIYPRETYDLVKRDMYNTAETVTILISRELLPYLEREISDD